jgi:hypothetical protein
MAVSETEIKDISMKFNRALIYIDSTGLGEPIYEDLVRAGVPCEPVHFTNEIKKQMIEKLSSWIELKNIYMLNIEDTVQEFNSFTYDYSEKTGRVIYGAPPGFHDDIVFSHALAIWGLQTIIPVISPQTMTIVQRDIYEKTKAIENEQKGIVDFDIEEI